MRNVQPSHNNGLGKEVKRKLSPIRDINGPLLASSLQRLVKAPNTWAQKEVEGQSDSVGVDKGVGRTGLGKEKKGSKPNQSDSVKGKKALARARALQANSSGPARVERGKSPSLIHHTQTRPAQSYNGDQQPQVPPGFQFTAASCPETGCKVEGSDRREFRNGSSRSSCDSMLHRGLNQYATPQSKVELCWQ